MQQQGWSRNAPRKVDLRSERNSLGIWRGVCRLLEDVSTVLSHSWWSSDAGRTGGEMAEDPTLGNKAAPGVYSGEGAWKKLPRPSTAVNSLAPAFPQSAAPSPQKLWSQLLKE